MDILQTLIASAHTRVIKEPRGFMKILQFIFTICAFATTTSYMQELRVSVTCPSDNVSNVVSIPLFYDFKLYKLDNRVCSDQKLVLQQDYSSDSSFFVTVCVLAFLFTIIDLIVYTLFNRKYTEDFRLPNFDFVVHCVFSLLFLAASSAWANSLTSLKTATTIQTLVEENSALCSNNKCEIIEAPVFAKLNISIILGFLNLFLFASNLWFIYKETAYFKGKNDPSKSPNAEEPTI